MKTIAIATLTTALTITASALPVQANESADNQMSTMLSDYQQLTQRGQWINPWMPSGTGETIITGTSGDTHLNQLVATYTRESLDRGGWVNSLLNNADYASGNPILAVREGEGVTEQASPVRFTSPATIALLLR